MRNSNITSSDSRMFYNNNNLINNNKSHLPSSATSSSALEQAKFEAFRTAPYANSSSANRNGFATFI